MSDPLVAVDLFAGAGGFSTGLAMAVEDLNRDVELYAINHWEQAIETHERNHPWAHHFHAKVEELHPPNVVDAEQVDILVAGPECTHFSSARGGKPVNEQLRASPWHVVDWLEKLDVQNFLVENVPELESWGPVEDGQPTRNGDVFDAWVNALHALGYSVDWTTLNAADYGDATSRERLFVMGRREQRASFPDPTHSDDRDDLPDHRTAAEIIDWSEPGGSIWTRDLHDARKRPLKNSTMQRIAEGLRRHGADYLEPFADILEDIGRDEVRALRDQVVPAEYAPLVAEVIDRPFLVAAPARPHPTDATLLRQQSGGSPPAADAEPVPTVSSAGAIGLAVPGRSLIMPKNGAYRGLHSNPLYPPESRPHHTVTADPRSSLVTPYLAPLYNGREGQRPRTRSLDRPLMTVTASKSPAGLVSPSLWAFIDDYQASPRSHNRPLGTVTTRDQFALAIPALWPWGFDVSYRMLQPRELKQAQGFPADYEIVGNKRETTKQIGNAVPVHLAKALVTEALTGTEPSLQTYTDSEGAVADD